MSLVPVRPVRVPIALLVSMSSASFSPELDAVDDDNVFFVNVLRDFPPTASRAIIAAYISHLDSRADAVQAMSSNRHVSFALEVTGACLSLPLDDLELMNMAVNLLTRWLLFSPCPPPLLSSSAPSDDSGQLRHEAFLLIVTRQLVSVLKERRAANTEQFNRHVRLCRKVLEVFSHIARSYGVETSTGTDIRKLRPSCWFRVISIFCDACADLLSVQMPAVSNISLANALCAHAVRVLFDLWLRAPPIPLTHPLWSRLVEASSQWRHRRWFLRQWSQLCRGFLCRLVPIFRSIPTSDAANTNAECIDPTTFQIRWADGSFTPLCMPDEQVLIYWHRFMRCVLPFVHTLKDPESQLIVTDALALMLHALCAGLDKGTSRDGLTSADGRILMELFAPSLFAVCLQDGGNIFERARASAAAALCRLFSPHLSHFPLAHPAFSVLSDMHDGSDHARPVDPEGGSGANAFDATLSLSTGRLPLCSRDIEWAQKFLFAIMKLLSAQPSQPIVVNAVICNVSNIFVDLPISGARALVPVLLPHVKSILQEPSSLTTSVATVMAAQSGAAAQSVSMVSTPVRRASLQLLGSILGLYARLIPATKQLEASEGADSVSTESWRALSKMRHHLIGVPNLLMNAMACEKDPYNQELLIWYCYLHLVDDAGCSSPSFPHLALTTIWQFIREGSWSFQVSMTAIFMLTQVASSCFKFVHNSNAATADVLVSEFCKFIEARAAQISSASDSRRGSSVSLLQGQHDVAMCTSVTQCLTAWLRVSAEFSATTLIDSQPDEVSLGQHLSTKSLPAATKVASLPRIENSDFRTAVSRLWDVILNVVGSEHHSSFSSSFSFKPRLNASPNSHDWRHRIPLFEASATSTLIPSADKPWLHFLLSQQSDSPTLVSLQDFPADDSDTTISTLIILRSSTGTRSWVMRHVFSHRQHNSSTETSNAPDTSSANDAAGSDIIEPPQVDILDIAHAAPRPRAHASKQAMSHVALAMTVPSPTGASVADSSKKSALASALGRLRRVQKQPNRPESFNHGALVANTATLSNSTRSLTAARYLFSSTGLLARQQASVSAFPVTLLSPSVLGKSDSAQSVDLQQFISQLDALSTRNRFVASVYYRREGESVEAQWLTGAELKEPRNDFVELLRSLGLRISDLSADGSLFWEDQQSELVFQVPLLNCNHEQRHSFVKIVFSESPSYFQPQPRACDPALPTVFLIVYPLGSDMFRVKVMAPHFPGLFEPNMSSDGIGLSWKMLHGYAHSPAIDQVPAAHASAANLTVHQSSASASFGADQSCFELPCTSSAPVDHSTSTMLTSECDETTDAYFSHSSARPYPMLSGIMVQAPAPATAPLQPVTEPALSDFISSPNPRSSSISLLSAGSQQATLYAQGDQAQSSISVECAALQCGPLVDECVVSRASLASLLRDTTIALSSRITKHMGESLSGASSSIFKRASLLSTLQHVIDAKKGCANTTAALFSFDVNSSAEVGATSILPLF